jgi:phosphonate transport system permease protein
MLYRWEVILRESAIFGILGVRTLGYNVDAATSELRLDVAVLSALSRCSPFHADALSRNLRLRIGTLPTRLSSDAGLSTALAR